ncbi:MAG: OmpA family protein [Oligoflexia bacterium]|nr:OmpA family protein [Oligoflexia bacterium]
MSEAEGDKHGSGGENAGGGGGAHGGGGHKKHKGGGHGGGGHGDGVNLERWLVSYADFMTLLFCVFVLLYAMSVVDKKKVQEVAMGVVKAMGGGPDKKAKDEVDINRGGHMDGASGMLEQRGRDILPDYHMKRVSDNQFELIRAEELADQIENSLQETLPSEQSNTIKVSALPGVGVRITLPDEQLFEHGTLNISKVGSVAVDTFASILEQSNNTVVIEGYADRYDKMSGNYKNLWEYSAAKGMSVLNYMSSKFNINNKRLSMQAFGEYFSLSSAQSGAAEAVNTNTYKNRRVNVIILGEKKADDF